VWQIEDCRTKRLFEYRDHDLRNFYAEGKLKFVGTERTLGAPPKKAMSVDHAPHLWEAAKERRAYVQAVLDLPSTGSRLIGIIQTVWEQMRGRDAPPNVSTVLRWKSKFIKAGKDLNALVEQHCKKGNSKPRHPDDLTEIVQEAINAKYLKLERGTIQDVIDKAKIDVLRENDLRPASTALPTPTRRLVRRLIEAIPVYDRYVARYGRTAADKKWRGVRQHRTTAAPLERVEMDHTPLNLMVVDDDTGQPLGRPWVTAAIDDYTRCVLGMHISFDPPSYLTVAECLKHAMLPKTSLRKLYPRIVNDWDAHGVMRELVVDNGLEFHSTSLENACLSLGIEIHYAARKTPWFKGKIERFLGTFNRGVAHGVRGTTFGDLFEKADYDPTKHAVVRYSTLKEVAMMWIVDVYSQKEHRTLHVPPATMWANSIDPDEILLPDDLARFDAVLGKSEGRSLTHKGIELDGLLYNSADLISLRRKHGEAFDVEIRVNPQNLGTIVVFSPDLRDMFVVPAISRDYAAGLSAWQHKLNKRMAGAQRLKNSPDGWLKAKELIAEIMGAEVLKRKRTPNGAWARYKGNPALPAGGKATPRIEASAVDARILPAKSDAAAEGSAPADSEAAQSAAPSSVQSNPVEGPSRNSHAVDRPARRRLKPVHSERRSVFDNTPADAE
jgi:putative transposase